MFPEGRVSEIQERQMTTVPDANIRCVSVEGSFDDCQDIVKAAFADKPFRYHRKLHTECTTGPLCAGKMNRSFRGCHVFEHEKNNADDRNIR